MSGDSIHVAFHPEYTSTGEDHYGNAIGQAQILVEGELAAGVVTVGKYEVVPRAGWTSQGVLVTTTPDNLGGQYIRARLSSSSSDNAYAYISAHPSSDFDYELLTVWGEEEGDLELELLHGSARYRINEGAWIDIDLEGLRQEVGWYTEIHQESDIWEFAWSGIQIYQTPTQGEFLKHPVSLTTPWMINDITFSRVPFSRFWRSLRNCREV